MLKHATNSAVEVHRMFSEGTNLIIVYGLYTCSSQNLLLDETKSAMYPMNNLVERTIAQHKNEIATVLR